MMEMKKYIIAALLLCGLFYIAPASAQDHEIKIDPTQDKDSVYIMLSDPNPGKYRHGRGKWTNYVDWFNGVMDSLDAHGMGGFFGSSTSSGATVQDGSGEDFTFEFADQIKISATDSVTIESTGDDIKLNSEEGAVILSSGGEGVRITPLPTLDDTMGFADRMMMIDTVTGRIYSKRPYKVYTAIIEQCDTTPVSTVLENTIGALTWEYIGVGQYRLVSATPVFTQGKTVYVQNYLVFDYGSSSTYIAIYTYSGTTEMIFDILNKADLQPIDCVWSTLFEIRVYN